MTHKLVKYRLNSDGTVPTFLKFGVNQATTGLFPVFDSNTASPRDYVMLGISDNGADISTAVGEITSQVDLTTYLTNSSVVDGVQTWKTHNNNNEEVDFVPADAATIIWNDLTTLNGG